MIDTPGQGHVGALVTLGAGAQVHESAYVDDGAVIGAASRVWHFAHVMGGAASETSARWARTWSLNACGW
jgi:UDP-2-acetamido-3-amino-2,3-dideoxy-glucuronate N-acetyltransferase